MLVMINRGCPAIQCIRMTEDQAGNRLTSLHRTLDIRNSRETKFCSKELGQLVLQQTDSGMSGSVYVWQDFGSASITVLDDNTIRDRRAAKDNTAVVLHRIPLGMLR